MASYVMATNRVVITMARLYRCYIHIGVGSDRCSFDGTGQCESLESRMTTKRFTLFLCPYGKNGTKNDMKGYFSLNMTLMVEW